MSNQFLSIKEAADRYQKAEITIRRLVRDIVKKSQSADRNLVSPAPAEIKKLKAKKRPFSYAIADELLQKAYGEAAESGAQKVEKAEKETNYTELLEKTNDGLRSQLSVKDEQIRALNQALDDLSERQRETNIIMKGFQEKFLLLPEQQERKKRWWSRK